MLRILLAAFLSILLVAGSADAAFDDLDFGQLPSAQGWTYETNDSAAEQDVFSLCNGLLVQDSVGMGSTTPGYIRTDLVDAVDPFSFTVKARVVAEEIFAFGPAQGLQIAVVVNGLSYNVVVGPNELRHSDGAGGSAPFSFDGDVFHTFVLEGTPGVGAFTITIDGTTVINAAGDPTVAVDGVRFGDGSSTGNGHAEIESVSFSQGPQLEETSFGSLPSAQGWTYETNDSAAEQDVFSLCNGLLVQDSVGMGSTTPGYIRTDLVDALDPFSFTVRARVVAEEIFAFGPAQGLQIAVVVSGLSYNVVVGPNELRHSDGAGGSAPFSFDGDVFHTFVLEGTPGVGAFTITIDGTTVINAAGDPTVAVDGVRFGDGSSTGNGHAEIESVTFSQGPGVPALPPMSLMALALALTGVGTFLGRSASRPGRGAPR